MLASGERNGEGVSGCGAPTHFLPQFPTSPLPHSLHLSYISHYLPHIPTHFPTPPLIPLPTSPLPPPTTQHIFLPSPHLLSPSQRVAKLPCDEVCVAKLLWRSYHVAKLLATVVEPTLPLLTEALPAPADHCTGRSILHCEAGR